VVRFSAIFWAAIAIQTLAPLCAEQPPTTLVPSDEFQTLITRIVRQTLPAEYEKRHNWNHTQRVFDGLKFEWDGGKLETRRRWKEANDGQWHWYRVRLVDPDQNFRVHVERFQAQENGKVRCDLAVETKLLVEGRLLQWERGVQLLSVDAQAEADARLQARLEIGGKVDAGKFPPSLYLEPVVQEAAVDVPRFRILRIGKLDGPLVKSLSHGAREVIEEKLAEARPKLVDKMNAEIKKSEAKLTLSLADLLKSPWGQAVEPLVK
jgi:hypothetical protein